MVNKKNRYNIMIRFTKLVDLKQGIAYGKIEKRSNKTLNEICKELSEREGKWDKIIIKTQNECELECT